MKVLLDVVYVEDVREYIHAPLTMVSYVKFNYIWKQLMEEDLTTFKYKYKYKHIPEVGLTSGRSF